MFCTAHLIVSTEDDFGRRTRLKVVQGRLDSPADLKMHFVTSEFVRSAIAQVESAVRWIYPRSNIALEDYLLSSRENNCSIPEGSVLIPNDLTNGEDSDSDMTDFVLFLTDSESCKAGINVHSGQLCVDR